jgi:hypothetical protein
VTGSISRRLYQHIILLYPEPFRREFGQEMLSVFDECQPAQKTSYLLADGLFAGLKQQLHYLATPARERTALYSEVPSSPRLARTLAMAVLVTAALASVFAPSQRPRRQSWATIHIEHRIWYLQCSNAELSATLPRTKPRKGE